MKKRVLDPAEEKYFLDNFGKAPVQEICKRLRFSTAAYYRLAKAYGLKPRDPHENGDPIEWTPEMLETLRREFPTALNQDLGRKLGISQTTLHRKARELKLTKAPDHRERNLKAIGARISRGQKASPKAAANPGRFQKSQRANPAGEFQAGRRNWHDVETPEQKAARIEKARQTRKQTTQQELLRRKLGFEPRIKQHLRLRYYIPAADDVEGWKRVHAMEKREYTIRHTLKKRGYRLDGFTAYYNQETQRCPKYESGKARCPFKFMPEPAKAPEVAAL